MTPDSAIWQILLPMALLGIGNAFIWAPNSATATRNLPIAAGRRRRRASTTRPGRSAPCWARPPSRCCMDSRLAAQGLPVVQPSEGGGTGAAAGGRRRDVQRRDGPGMLLPPAVLVLGLVAVLFFERPRHAGYAAAPAPAGASAGGEPRDAVT